VALPGKSKKVFLWQSTTEILSKRFIYIILKHVLFSDKINILTKLTNIYTLRLHDGKDQKLSKSPKYFAELIHKVFWRGDNTLRFHPLQEPAPKIDKQALFISSLTAWISYFSTHMTFHLSDN